MLINYVNTINYLDFYTPKKYNIVDLPYSGKIKILYIERKNTL